MSQYPLEIFVDRPDDEFICIICMNVLDDPRQCPSGHLFCVGCITAYLRDHGICPACRCQLSVTTLSNALFVRESVMKLKTKCPCVTSPTCPCYWEGMLLERGNHILECPCMDVHCDRPGCGAVFPRAASQEHRLRCNNPNTAIREAEYERGVMALTCRADRLTLENSCLRYMFRNHSTQPENFRRVYGKILFDLVGRLDAIQSASLISRLNGQFEPFLAHEPFCMVVIEYPMPLSYNIWSELTMYSLDEFNSVRVQARQVAEKCYELHIMVVGEHRFATTVTLIDPVDFYSRMIEEVHSKDIITSDGFHWDRMALTIVLTTKMLN